MAMDLAGAGVSVGGNLIAELLREQAQQDQLKQERTFNAEQQGFQAQRDGATQLANADKSAYNQLMQVWAKGLGVG